jgi:hypothetical protein
MFRRLDVAAVIGMLLLLMLARLDISLKHLPGAAGLAALAAQQESPK